MRVAVPDKSFAANAKKIAASHARALHVVRAETPELMQFLYREEKLTWKKNFKKNFGQKNILAFLKIRRSENAKQNFFYPRPDHS